MEKCETHININYRIYHIHTQHIQIAQSYNDGSYRLNKMDINVERIATSSLNGLVNAGEGFIDVVYSPFTKLEPTLIRLLSDTSTIIDALAEDWRDILSVNVSLIICLSLAVLYLIIDLLGGIIWCSCHCCCKRKKKQSSKQADSCWKYSHLFFSILFGLLLAISSIFIFLSNQNVYEFIPTIPDKLILIIETAESVFEQISNLVTEVDSTTIALLGSISSQVLNIKDAFAVPLISDIQKTIDVPFGNLKSLPDSITQIKDSLALIDSGITSLSNQQTTVVNEVSAVLNQLDNDSKPPTCTDDATACTTLNTLAANADFQGPDTSNLSSVSTEINDLDNLLSSQDIDQVVQDAENSIDDLLLEIDTQISDLENDLRQEFLNVNTTVEDGLKQLDQVRDLVTDFETTLSKWEDTFDDIKEPIDKYIVYFWGVTIGLSTVILLIFLIGMIGYCCGCIGGGFRATPSMRSKGSNFGSKLLISSSCIGILFAFILMILTTVLFLIAGVVRSYLCLPLESPNFDLLRFLDENPTIHNVNLTNVLSDSGMTWNPPLGQVKFKTLISSCQKDDSLYDIFDLQNVAELDIKNYIDISSQIDSIKNEITTQLSNEITDSTAAVMGDWDDDMKTYTTDIENTINSIDFSGMLDSVNSGISGSGDALGTIIDDLDALSLRVTLFEGSEIGTRVCIICVITMNDLTLQLHLFMQIRLVIKLSVI